MKNILKTTLFLALSASLLAGCGSSGEGGGKVVGNTNYTIMIYMCGSNLESQKDEEGNLVAAATRNLLEILSVKNQPKNVNIVVQTGGASKWSTAAATISNKVNERWHIRNQKMVKDESLTDLNMGASATLQGFLEYGIKKYPADKHALIFWDHGGAMTGVCSDEKHSDDVLINSEVQTALSNALKNTNKEKLEWVGYDTCLMAVQDIVETNSHYFNYMVAAEESEPDGGWDYDNWIDDIYKNPDIETPKLLTEICNTYSKKCEQYYKDYANYCYEYYQQTGDDEAYEEYQYYKDFNDATLAAYDLSKANNYLTKFEAMATYLKNNVIKSKSNFTTFVNNIANKSQRFGVTEDYYGNEIYPFDVFDAYQVLNKMKASSTYNKAPIDEVLSAFNDLVIYNKYGKSYGSALGGMSMFIAASGYSAKSDYSASETNFTNWRTLNTSYGSWNY